MTVKARILMLIILVLVLMIIINMIKKRDLDLKYALLWLFCDVVLIVISLFPEFMRSLALVLGIQSSVNMIFFLGFLFSLLIIFSLTVSLSRVTGKVRRLAQIISMLPEEVKKDLMDEVNCDNGR